MKEDKSKCNIINDKILIDREDLIYLLDMTRGYISDECMEDEYEDKIKEILNRCGLTSSDLPIIC